MNIEKKILTWKNNLETIAEVGWQEVQTTAYIKKCIGQPSIIEGLGENQIGAAFILGSGKQKIFLRADIDGLPVTNGVKHICGHSAHVAALLGAYHILAEKVEELNKKDKQVLFIFQPAEETFPSGAKAFVDTYPRLFKNCLYGFGLHDMPNLPIGTIELKKDIRSAAGDYIEIEVIGKSIHVEHTPKGIDAIYGASLIIQAVRDFQKTFSNFGKRVVFNIDTIEGGTVPNIIAGKVKMTGDIRWFDRKDKKKIKEFFYKIPNIIEEKFEGKVKITYYDGYPILKNDPQLTKKITDFIKRNSNFSVLENGIENLGIEDFCFYTDLVPCLYANVGVGGKYLLHEENFIVSDIGVLAILNYWKLILDWWIGCKYKKE